ncbi:hypothetical protein F511_34339 [Dorcoceras hygrometricum]|uniref:Uncharacterized protein n=1 Tax=Dorcoceras hygrometricum TaxID=472368 RepID=A0A2Z7BTC8_9LAMI|nr:hypothetical protein F511_34339 [Dorcoceras hygrometricum]
MSSFKNPLTAILDCNKFTGLNYQDWLHNLNLVLASEKLLYTIEKCPPKEAPADICWGSGSAPPIRQSGPRLDPRFLRQTALEVLTRSARSDSPRKTRPEQNSGEVGRRWRRRTAAAAAAAREEKGGGGLLGLGLMSVVIMKSLYH